MIRWTEIEMTTLNWGEEFDPIDRISKRIRQKRPRALDHSRRHTHSLDFFHLALAHTLTRLYMPVEYSQMDYYQSGSYVTIGLFQTTNLILERKKNGTGREIWFPVGARLLVFHNAMPRPKITVPCSDVERIDLLPIQNLIDPRLHLMENSINEQISQVNR